MLRARGGDEADVVHIEAEVLRGARARVGAEAGVGLAAREGQVRDAGLEGDLDRLVDEAVVMVALAGEQREGGDGEERGDVLHPENISRPAPGVTATDCRAQVQRSDGQGAPHASHSPSMRRSASVGAGEPIGMSVFTASGPAAAASSVCSISSRTSVTLSKL